MASKWREWTINRIFLPEELATLDNDCITLVEKAALDDALELIGEAENVLSTLLSYNMDQVPIEPTVGKLIWSDENRKVLKKIKAFKDRGSE